jgi:hypothetical protein
MAEAMAIRAAVRIMRVLPIEILVLDALLAGVWQTAKADVSSHVDLLGSASYQLQEQVDGRDVKMVILPATASL